MAKDNGILHHGYLESAEGGIAKTGTQEIVLIFDVPYVSANGAWADIVPTRKAHVHIYLSDAAWKMSREKLESLGFNGDFANPEFSPDIKNDGVDLLQRFEDYEGRKTEKWELARWGSGVAPLAQDAAAALNARWRAGARPPVPSGRPATPPAAVSQAPVVMRQPTPTARPAMPAPPKSTQAQGELQMPAPAPQEGTRDWAWDTFINENAGAPDLTRWNAILATIGKPEPQFTHEDWINVHREVLAQALPV